MNVNKRKSSASIEDADYLAGKICKSCGVNLCKSNTLECYIKRRDYSCIECRRRRDREVKNKSYSPQEAKFKNARRIKSLKANDPLRWTAQRMVYGSRQRAKKKGLKCDLTVDFVIGICPVCCPALKVKLLYGGSDRHDFAPSIDKIDPRGGYTMDNVQIVSYLANRMKSDASQEHLVEFSKWVLSI